MVYIGIFATIELCFSLDAASYFAKADGKPDIALTLAKSAGVFGFTSGLLGYYAVLYYLCQDALPFKVPMGDTSRFFSKISKG